MSFEAAATFSVFVGDVHGYSVSHGAGWLSVLRNLSDTWYTGDYYFWG
jgi:hypothetical protein